MMAAKTLFWIFVAFYVTVKVCFFVGVYIATKIIEKRALKAKEMRREHNRLVELEFLVEEYEKRSRALQKDKEIYGATRKRFIA